MIPLWIVFLIATMATEGITLPPPKDELGKGTPK